MTTLAAQQLTFTFQSNPVAIFDCQGEVSDLKITKANGKISRRCNFKLTVTRNGSVEIFQVTLWGALSLTDIKNGDVVTVEGSLISKEWKGWYGRIVHTYEITAKKVVLG